MNETLTARLAAMSKDERGLLLYMETCAVDYGGKMQSIRMNETDFSIAEQWAKTGFVGFGRIAMEDIKSRGESGEYPRTHWCTLSDDAWSLAHQERRLRCDRIMAGQTFTRIGANG